MKKERKPLYKQILKDVSIDNYYEKENNLEQSLDYELENNMYVSNKKNYKNKKELCYFENLNNKGIVHNSIVDEMVSSGDFIFNNYLMKYKEEYGYFETLDNHKAKVKIYSKIPKECLKVVKDTSIYSSL